MVLHYMTSRHPADELRREVNHLISGFFGNSADGTTARTARPAVNVRETEDAVEVELETPGVTGDQTDISVTGNELTVKVERPEVEEEGVTHHRRERGVGSFTRVLRIPVDIDGERVEANLRHGVLTVRLPKSESAKPRKIEVATVA